MATYAICYSNGRVDGGYESYDAALAVVSADFAVVGHSGDLSDGGDRTLFWASEKAAKNDDGARAAGSIREVQS